MGKAITEEAKLPTRSFVDYIIRYAAPILAPVLIVISWVYPAILKRLPAQEVNVRREASPKSRVAFSLSPAGRSGMLAT